MTDYGRRRNRSPPQRTSWNAASRSSPQPTPLSAATTLPPYRFLWDVSVVFYVYGKSYHGNGAENGYSYRANCCEVQGPDRDPYLHAHAGFHDCTLERTYSNMKCRDLLGDFLWWLMNVPEDTRSLHVGVYCVRGRHRSPAVAWIMSCMAQGLGCRSVYTEYIER